MSDSDDTDVLLLIPPDFFLVHSSDSEDSTGPELREECNKNCEFEKLVVNDLISQVNELENRICVIENKSSVNLPRNLQKTRYLHQFFDCSTYLGSDTYQDLRHDDLMLKSQSMLASRHRFDRVSDNLKHQAVNCGNSNFHSTPVKQGHAFSLPSTPSTIGRSTSHFTSHSKQEKSAIKIEPMTLSEVLSMSLPVVGNIASSSRATTIGEIQYPSNNGKQNQTHQDSSLIGEIDQFLDSVKKNTEVQTQMVMSEHNKKENIYRCGEYSASVPDRGFGLKDFNNLPVREEIIKAKHITPLEKEETVFVKQAELDEVDELLREAENDLKDRKRPNPKPIHEQPYQQKKVYASGDDINSVPDLGFGLRSFNSLPVREQEIKQKTVLPLETHQVDTEMQGLKLSDIEKLLKQMEATQCEIEKKLQLRESLIEESSAISERDHVPAPQKTSFAGDTIGSIPDRGFGIRGIFTSSKPVPTPNVVNSGNGTKVPVHEEIVTRRNISLLGTDVTPDKTQVPQVHSSSEHPNEQNIHASNGETTEITGNAQQISSKYLAEHGDLTKVAFARRKLELGSDAFTIPDYGFGLKLWYNSEKNKDGCSESLIHSFHNIPHNVHDDVTPSHPYDGGSAVPSTGKSSYIQGDYLPSIPDLGFGLRNLWTSSTLPQGVERNSVAYIPRSSQTSTQNKIHQIYTNNDLNTVEYLSQVQPHMTSGEANRSKTTDQWIGDHRSSTQDQNNLVDEENRGSSVTDTMAKKKVDFSVGSGQRDVAIMQQEQGTESNIAEGLRNEPDYGNSFRESCVSGVTASVSSGTSNLLSLSELWGKDGSSSAFQVRDEHTNIRVRLEEEKYRRQHCERLIQQLQIHLLEEQQKLAVAVQVDRCKDQAILQVQGAWNCLVQHWKELEEQRHSLASRLQREREAHQRQESEMMQKLERLESELSKALDLAKGYKEKVDSIEKEKLELIEHHKSEIRNLMDRIKEGEQKLENANQLNCDSLEKVKQAEQEAQKERKLLIDAQREVEDTHRKLNSFEAELFALKEEKETLQLKLKEEKGRISILDQQKKSLQAAADEYKKKEKSIREEIKQLTVQSEKMKVELREYYQEQLEVVVNDKLREFQEQLEAAETSLHKELEQREHTITEMASKQVKEISEKHQLEVQLLEEKHAEELKLYKLQLAQAVQQVSELEARKSEMVEKLHSVMETQWQEAMHIFDENSPLVNHGAKHVRLQSTGSSAADEMPFSREESVTYKKAEQSISLQESPISKGFPKTNEEDETKKYIMMLLNRTPGNPLDEGKQATDHKPDTHDEKLRQNGHSQDDKRHELADVPTNEISHHSKWENILQHDSQPSQQQSIPSIPPYDLSKAGHGSTRDGRRTKPPWK